MADQVGVRELKAHLSYYLRKVSEGGVLVVTERGRPLAEIRPAGEQPASRLAALVAAGQVKWSGKKLRVTEPPATTYPGRSVADLVLKDRE